jgi:hypothetical protein
MTALARKCVRMRRIRTTSADEESYLDLRHDPTVTHGTLHPLAGGAERPRDVERFEADPQLAGLHPGVVEEVREHGVERADVRVHPGHELEPAFLVERVPVLLQRDAVPRQHRERRSHLVGDRRQELALEAIALLEPADGLPSLFEALPVDEREPCPRREEVEGRDMVRTRSRIAVDDADEDRRDPPVDPDRACDRSGRIAVGRGYGNLSRHRVAVRQHGLASVQDQVGHPRGDRTEIVEILEGARCLERSVSHPIVLEHPERGAVVPELDDRPNRDRRHLVRPAAHLLRGPGQGQERVARAPPRVRLRFGHWSSRRCRGCGEVPGLITPIGGSSSG